MQPIGIAHYRVLPYALRSMRHRLNRPARATRMVDDTEQTDRFPPLATMPTAVHSATIADAQHDMRVAYFGGAPGMLTSAVVWGIAGIVALRVSPERAIWALFIGGMLIHPVSVVFAKLLGRTGTHRTDNPFGTLALATTVWMILCLPLAYGVSLQRIDWFFPAMLFVIGGRYLTFATVFGTRVYWLCGASLATAGYALAAAHASPAVSAFAGAAIEAAFAALIMAGARRVTVS